MIFFLDFEASSLSPDSFPIEVAWVNGDGQSESYLIRPAEEWLNPAMGWAEWSAASERVHGISLRQLREEGVPHEQVAKRVLEALGSRQHFVASDAPPFDENWMSTLLEAAGVRRRIPVVDVMMIYGFACRPLLNRIPPAGTAGHAEAELKVSNTVRGIVERATDAEALRPRVHHRALADAQSLWRIWRAIGDDVKRQVSREGDR